MLVLTRKKGQAVVAGDVRVKVLSVNGNRVKLGFVGPLGCKILRAELPPQKAPDQGPTHWMELAEPPKER